MDHVFEQTNHFPTSLSPTLLAAAVASASVGVAITDPRLPDNPVIYINEAFRAMTGYESAEVLGRNCRFLQGPETNRETVARMREAFTNGRGCREILLNYTKSGQPFWNELTVTPIFSSDEELVGFAGFQSDVTERVTAQNQARLAVAEAQRANVAKSEFLSRMSHELRTPLNAILGFAQMMELDATDEQTRQDLDYILNAGRHLLGLINEVLDVARVESGRISVDAENLPLTLVLDEVMALIKPLAVERNINVSCPPMDESVIVRADRQRLVQILLNLLSNAVKYNSEGGEIRIACQQTTLPALHMQLAWRVAISDDGAGLLPEKRERLFQPFERLGAENSAISGTGLGLALSLRLAQAMQGELGLEPFQQGVGSTFWLKLPAGVLLPESQHEEEQLLEYAADSEATFRPQLVLYIEDNKANFELVERILGQVPGVELIGAPRGNLGLEITRQQQPSLILLDLHLPDMRGEEVLAALQQEETTAQIPVFIVSAEAFAEKIEQLCREGAREYFAKPIDVQQFLKSVRSVLRAS